MTVHVLDGNATLTAMSERKETKAILAEDVAQFTQYVRFVSRDPNNNRERFYVLSWQHTLQGDTVLLCRWGRLGTQGRSRTIIYAHHDQVREKIMRLIKRRLQRGYHITEWQ